MTKAGSHAAWLKRLRRQERQLEALMASAKVPDVEGLRAKLQHDQDTAFDFFPKGVALTSYDRYERTMDAVSNVSGFADMVVFSLKEALVELRKIRRSAEKTKSLNLNLHRQRQRG